MKQSGLFNIHQQYFTSIGFLFFKKIDFPRFNKIRKPFTFLMGLLLVLAIGCNTKTNNKNEDTSPPISNPGFTISDISGNTGEDGTQSNFTVKLNSEPTTDVEIPLFSSDTGEGTVSPTRLAFTPLNWNAPQTVTVTGINDTMADGNQIYTIILDVVTSSDINYNGLNPDDVSVTNTDNDSAGFNVSAISGNTSEDGGSATFTVKLNSEPTSDVVIPLSSSDIGEGTVSPVSLTFTALNWNAPQTVTVTGVNDAIIDGNQVYSIILDAVTSSDNGYNGLNPNDVSVTNMDNDAAGFTISAISGNSSEDGGIATFTIKLTFNPTADVVIPLSSSDIGEGTVSPVSLTFTALNWNAPQTVTVTGVNDAIADGIQVYSIILDAVTSSDANYSGLNPSDVSVTNTDNDSAGFTISAISGNTTEAGGSATFTVKLNSEPTADVVIPLSSSNTSEGTVSLSGLTFTPLNWNAPQTVTVTGVNDAIADGNQVYSVILDFVTSLNSNYSGLNPSDVSVTNTDNDSAGFTVSAISGNTSEDGGSATFTVKLNSEPTADVVVPLSSSDTGEGTVSPSSLTFTPLNWNAPQTVIVTGVNDAIADGNQVYFIILDAVTSLDSGYSGLNPDDVSVTNTDNDSAGFTISAISGNTSEDGGSAIFTVKLNSEPTSDVVIPLSSSDLSEGSVFPASLTFTPLNWNAPQTVTVTGVNDAIIDGNQVYSVILDAVTSSDIGYNGLNPNDVSVTNTDNDSAGFTISAISGNSSEAGGSASFTVRLNSEPTADVVIPLSSSDTGEGTVSPAGLTFTALNWNAPQTVTVTGVNDAIADGNQVYSIILDAVTSLDSNYTGLNPTDVSVTNTDNESAGIMVNPVSGLITSEAGGVASFTVVLNSEPMANVSIPISSSDTTEVLLKGGDSPSVAVSAITLTFSPLDWSMPQTVTAIGQDDMVFDESQIISILTGAAISTDTVYNNFDALDVQVSNNDNETPEVYVSSTGSDLNPGTSTQPKQTIQAAIDYAISKWSNAKILIAQGTYSINSSIIISNGISLYGGYSASDWQLRDSNLYITEIIDTRTSGGTGTNPLSVIYANNVSTSGSIIDGLKITGATASASSIIAGIFSENSSVTISNNNINGGSGGLASYGIYTYDMINFQNRTVIISNNAIDGGSCNNSTGIFNSLGAQKILSLTISGNQINGGTGSVESIGIKASVTNTSGDYRPLIFQNNVNGGTSNNTTGMYFGFSGLTVYQRPVISYNIINGGMATNLSTGVRLSSAHASFFNNRISAKGYAAYGLNISGYFTTSTSVVSNTIVSDGSDTSVCVIMGSVSIDLEHNILIAKNGTAFQRAIQETQAANGDANLVRYNTLFASVAYYDADGKCTANNDGDNNVYTCNIADMSSLGVITSSPSGNLAVNPVLQSDDTFTPSVSPCSVTQGGYSFLYQFYSYSDDINKTARTNNWSMGAIEYDGACQ